MISKGFYKHWKGGVYFVQGIALDDESQEELVVYESVQGCEVSKFYPPASTPAMRVRTLAAFTEEVQDRDGHTVPRFTRIDSWPT